jgi:hypothetical protein
MPDVLASNGYVHAISRVLFPPPAFVKTLAPMPEGALGDMPSTGGGGGGEEQQQQQPPASG